MDPRTVALMILISGAECSLLFFGACFMRSKAEPYPPSFFWGLGAASEVLGLAALLTQGKSPHWFGVLVADAAMTLGQILINLGIRRLMERKVPVFRYAASLAAYVLLLGVFTYAFPSTSARILVFSAVIAVYSMEGAALCLRAKSTIRGWLAPLMAGTFILLALFYISRASLAFLFPQPSVFTKNAITIATFLVSYFGLIAWCLGLILMQNRKMELDLERAYEEKGVLLRELQHRVKNSFSVIASLVSLESSRTNDERAAAAMACLQDRIQAIAALYDQLFQSGEASLVDLDAYLKTVAESLFTGQAASDRRVALELDLDRVEIDAKRAAAVGLIANELLTDSFKYAFPGGRGGKIRLALKRVDGDCVLEVRDDGVGLPEDFSPGASGGFGLELVETLAAQVGGRFSVSSEGGTRFSVRFPLTAKAQSVP